MKKLMKFKKTNTLLESENEKWKVGEEMSEICVVFAEHIPDVLGIVTARVVEELVNSENVNIEEITQDTVTFNEVRKMGWREDAGTARIRVKTSIQYIEDVKVV